MVTYEGEKMSKSIGNTISPAQMLQMARPLVVRYYLVVRITVRFLITVRRLCRRRQPLLSVLRRSLLQLRIC